MAGMGEYKSRLQITREEKAKGKHHTQKKETFAGAPTLAGAAEVGTAFAKSSVDDSGAETKWTFRIPILADFGGQRVGDIFGDEVRGLHSTYNNKIKSLAIGSLQVRTVAGSGENGAIDGHAFEASFNEPSGLSVFEGKVYVADTNNHAIRVIELATQQVSTLEITE